MTNDEIQKRAYGIWLEQGCPEGCALENWAQAERELAAEHKQEEDWQTKTPRWASGQAEHEQPAKHEQEVRSNFEKNQQSFTPAPAQPPLAP